MGIMNKVYLRKGLVTVSISVEGGYTIFDEGRRRVIALAERVAAKLR